MALPVPIDDVPDASGEPAPRPQASPSPVPADDLPGTLDAPAPPVGPDELQASFRATAQVNPDEHARIERVARETGAPRQLVKQNAAGFEAANPPRQLQHMHETAPVASRFVADPRNMALARDDLAQLSAVEWALTGGLVSGTSEAGPWSEPEARYQAPVWFEAWRKGVAGIRVDLEKTRRALGLGTWASPYDQEDSALLKAAKLVAPPVAIWEAVSERLLRPLSESAAEQLQTADQALAERELHAKTLAARAWAGAFGAGPFVLANLGMGAVAGLPGMMAFNAATIYGRTREQLEEVRGPGGERLSEGAVAALSVGLTLGESALYSVGAGAVGKSLVRPVVKRLPAALMEKTLAGSAPAILGRLIGRWGVHTAEGAATMAAATALEDATIQGSRMSVGAQEEFDFNALRDRTFKTFEDGLVDFALLSAVGPGRQFLHDVGVSRASARQAEALRAAAKAMSESKLLERDPQAAEDLVGRMNPGATALVERAAWDRYWTEQRVDPARKAGELVGDGGRAYEASAGGFLALPLERYLARLAKTEHILHLAADVKLSADARTPREEARFQQEAVRMDEEARRARGQRFDEDQARIENLARDQAIAAGVERQQAAAVANLYATSVGATAIRTGLTVDEAALLMGTSRFRFLGKQGDRVARATHDEILAGLSPAARTEIVAARNGDRRAQQRLEAKAYVDPLTQLVNRNGFEDYRRAPAPGGWDVSVDLNDLKAQDLLGGHAAGDLMLQTVAQAMREANEKTGGKARLFRRSGDEFHGGALRTKAEAQALGKAIIDRLNASKPVGGSFKVSVAVGIGPGVEAADVGVYLAKAEKAAKVGVYEKGKPELLEKLGGGESFMALHEAAAEPLGEVPAARIADKAVTLVPEIPFPERTAARVITPQRPGTGDPVHYRVIEAEQLVTSHSAETFSPTKDYPAGVQERDYKRLREEQAKVRKGAQQLDPAFLLADTPSALDGPPIVTGGERHLVLGGNGRSMMLLLGFKEEATAKRYRGALVARAGALGLDPADIAAMKRPVLVRVMDEVGSAAPKADLVAAVRRFNEGMTQALSPRLRAIADAKTMGPETVESIGQILAEGEGSLAELMQEVPGRLAEILRRDGIVTAQNQGEWFRPGGAFTDEGRERLRGMFTGRIIETADRAASTSSSLEAKIERVAPALVRVEGMNQELSEIPAVQRAIDLVNEARIRNMSIDQVVAQLPLFGGDRPDGATVALARLLESAKPTDLQQRFQAWAGRAAFDPRQATMFGGQATREEARAILLGQATTLEQREQRGVGGAPDLVAQHNLTAENLIHADELGGVAVPSIAISRKEQALKGFGEITLLAPPDLVAPEKGTPVFGADIYSPRWPETRWKIVGKELRRVRELLSPFAKQVNLYLGDVENELKKGGLEELLKRPDWRAALGLAYLAEKGRTIPEFTREAAVLFGDLFRMPAFKAFLKEHKPSSQFEAGDAYHVALSKAFVESARQLDKKVEGAGSAWLDDSQYGPKANGLLSLGTADAMSKELAKFGTRVVDVGKMQDEALHAVNAEAVRPDFERWAREKVGPVFAGRYIQKWIDTMEGPKERAIAYTLENVVREMRRGPVRAASETILGLGVARAAGAKRFRTTESLRQAKESLVAHPEFERQREAISSEFFALVERLSPYLGPGRGGGLFERPDALRYSIMESYKRGHFLSKELELSGYSGVPPDLVQVVGDFARRLQAMPTEYFEAKPQRAVALSEFKAAVVPSTVDPKAVEVLKKHGIEVVTYKAKKTRFEADVQDMEELRRYTVAKTAERLGLLFQRGPAGPRGVVRMRLDATGRPVDFPVEILAGDASTAFHELGHFLSWAMHDIAAAPEGVAVAKDYAALVKWAGFESAEARLKANLERGQLEGRVDRTPAEEASLRDLQAKEERIGFGFEQYLAEGKAPSETLHRTFAQLRTWMGKVYEGLFQIGEQYRRHYGQDLRVNPEIRAVFDRWLAAEKEVRSAESAVTAEIPAGLLAALPPADRDAMLAARSRRQRVAEEGLFQTLTQAEKAERTSLRSKIRKEIEAQVDDLPPYRLLAYLERSRVPEAGLVDVALGNLDADLLDPHGRPWKLDLAEVVDVAGEDVVKRLPRGATAEKGGAPLDFFAQRFGFESGEEVVKALAATGTRDAVVEAKLRDRMRELYPTVAENPEGVVRAALDAEHSPEAVAEALVGARSLVREVDPTLELRVAVMRDAKTRNATAARIVSEQRVGDVQPERFLRAERTAAGDALDLTEKALRATDPAKRKEFAARAMDAYDAQLLNMGLYRAARDARAQLESARRYVQSFQGDDKRRELGKATSTVQGPEGKPVVTQPYLDRADDLVGSIDPSRSPAPFNRAERFAQWLETQSLDTQQDVKSRVSPRLIASLEKTRHWKSLTVAEVGELVAALEVIEAQAALKSRLRTAKGEREKEEFIEKAIAEIRARFPKGGGIRRFEEDEPLTRRLEVKAKRAKATLARPEELYRELGPTLSTVFETISDAELEARRLIREIGGPIVDLIEKLPREDRKFLHSTVVRTEEGRPISGQRILAAALNWGNLSNRRKMLGGELVLKDRGFKDVGPITPEVFEAGMAQLSKHHLGLVNKIHELVGEAKWEEIAALEAEFTGLAPPKIEAAPYTRTLPDGSTVDMRGGYYPVAYDHRFSEAGLRQGEQISQGVGALAFSPNYERAVTPQGHLVSRIEPYARPIDLSLRALPRAIVNHMRDLAMRRALVQTREILTDSRVRDAIQEAMGEDAYRVLVEHWRDSANEFAAPRGQPDWLLRWAQRRRTAVTGAVFAGNVAMAFQNFANVLPALDGVPARLVGKHFARYVAKQLPRFSVRRGEMIDRMIAESATMRERLEGWQTSAARATMNLVGQGQTALYAEKVREAGMWMMETTDLVTATPVYWAAKELAMRPKGEGVRGLPEAGSRATGLGMTEEQAIRHADQVVRLTQSSYRWMDKSAFERHNVFRHFTAFYGYMNSQLSRFMAAHADARVLRDQGFRDEALRRIIKTYALLMASGVMADLLVGKGPQDYDDTGDVGPDDWAKWVAMRAVLYPPSTLPVVGGYLQQLGGPGQGRDPSLMPFTRSVEAAIRAGHGAALAMGEEALPDDAYRAAWQALEAFGWYEGLPVAQMRRTGDYWLDISPDPEPWSLGLQLSEEAAQAGAGEAAFGTVYGPKRPGRLNQALFGGP